MVDHIVWEDNVNSNEMDVDPPSDLDESFNSIQDIPDRQPRIAATYVGELFIVLFSQSAEQSIFTISPSQNLPEMLVASTVNCPYHLALAFDELATVFQDFTKKSANRRKGHVNKQFLVWICDRICNYFMENFLTEDKPNDNPRLRLDFLYGLNALDELVAVEEEAAVSAVDVAGTVLKNSSR